jgi:hypothetical protein
MKYVGERGAVNILLIPLILLGLFLVGSLGFGMWAFTGRAEYKDKSDTRVAAAVSEAVDATQKADALKYAEEAKKPLDTYIGPSAFGNITVKYPKSWSAYVEESERGGPPVNGYFHPSIVPRTTDRNNSYALRVQLVQNSYDQVLSQFNAQVKAGKVTVTPYKLDKVPSVVGSRAEGQITSNKQGTMIILPLRNLTLEIWTEANTFKPDLDNIILSNLSFSP